MKRTFLSALALLGGLLMGAVSALASPLYGSDAAGNLLYNINPATGSHVQIGGSDPGHSLGLAYNSLTGVMYSTGLFNGTLYTVNLTTGATTAVGPSNGTNMTGLTFSGDFSTIYSLNFNGGPLLAVNPNTGAAVTIGATSGSGVTLLDLTTNSAGVVYGGGIGGIATVNTLTGATTAIGGSLSWTSIAFDENDVLYGIEIGSDALYTINTSTGAATLVGGDIGTDVRGLAFAFSVNQVPEPASLALLGLGLAGLGASRRKTLA